MSKIKKKRRKPKLFVYHRYVGLAVALFVIVLSITGILLNHTEALHLDEKPVTQRWLLKIYGIATPTPTAAWRVGDHWITQLGGQIYLNETSLKPLQHQQLVGAAPFNDMLIIASNENLALYTKEMELVDTLPALAIEQIGSHNGKLFIQSAEQSYQLDKNFSELIPIEKLPENVSFTNSGELPDTVFAAISHSYLGDGLPLERVMLDLHSGRLLGKIGVYLMDLVAILMVILTVTGMLIWIRRAIKRGQNEKNRSAR